MKSIERDTHTNYCLTSKEPGRARSVEQQQQQAAMRVEKEEGARRGKVRGCVGEGLVAF